MKKVEWIKDVPGNKIITINCFHNEKNISVTSYNYRVKDYAYAYQAILKELLKFIHFKIVKK